MLLVVVYNIYTRMSGSTINSLSPTIELVEYAKNQVVFTFVVDVVIIYNFIAVCISWMTISWVGICTVADAFFTSYIWPRGSSKFTVVVVCPIAVDNFDVFASQLWG